VRRSMGMCASCSAGRQMRSSSDARLAGSLLVVTLLLGGVGSLNRNKPAGLDSASRLDSSSYMLSCLVFGSLALSPLFFRLCQLEV
jgi:hypothetical protein